VGGAAAWMRKNHCLDSQAPSPTHHVTAAVRGHISRSTASLPPLASPGAQGARRADAASWQRPAGAGRRPRRLGHAAQPGFGACCAPRACAARAGAPEPPQPLHAGDGPSTLTKGEGCVAADARAVVLRAGGTLCEPARTLANEVTSLHFCHTGGSAVRYVWSLA